MIDLCTLRLLLVTESTQLYSIYIAKTIINVMELCVCVCRSTTKNSHMLDKCSCEIISLI